MTVDLENSLSIPHSAPDVVGGEYLTTVEASQLLRLSSSTLAKLRVYGGGPVYLKPGRKVLYRRDDLIAWLAGKQRRSTSQGPADV